MITLRNALARAVASIRLHLRWLFRRSRVERELVDELRFHIERQVEENTSRGMSPREAEAAARRQFGGLAQVEEECRDEWHVGLADRVGKDIRFGARMLARTPTLTAVAIGTLAIGIGATAALFGLLDTVLFSSITAPHPEQLFAIERSSGNGVSESMSATLFRALESGPPALGRVAGYAFRVSSLRDQDDSVVVQLTSRGWFSTVGVRPQIGRTWDSASGPAPEEVAVISDGLWHRRFGGSPTALGQTLNLDGHPLVIVGVMPKGFSGVSLDYRTDVLVPLELQPEFDGASLLEDGGRNWIRVVTRLDPTRPAQGALAAANLVLARERQARLIVADSLEQIALSAAARPDLQGRSSIAGTLSLLTLLAGLVLLIACANIASLQVARGAARRRELTIRVSLGASRARVVSQLFTESVLLALAGGATGLWLAAILRRLLTSIAAPSTSGLTADMAGSVDGRLLLFTTALTVLVAFASGLTPALGATRIDAMSVLKETASSMTGRTPRGRSALLIIQLAMSVVLLTAAGMVARTLRNVQTIDMGFAPDGLIQLTVDWRETSEQESRAFAGAIASALRSSPGVAGASVSMPAAYGRSTASSAAYHVANDPSSSPHPVEMMVISPEFFGTMRIPILRGRTFNASDVAGGPRVVVLNNAAARLFFPGQDPMGKQFQFLGPQRTVEVVGVVGDTRLHNAVRAPPPLVYMPFTQDPGIDPGDRTIEVRAAAPQTLALDQLTRTSAAVAPQLHVVARPMEALLAQSLALERLSAGATGAFGLAGLLLAIIGLYGLQSYLVAQRTAETGVRLALGASPGQVRWSMWRQGMRPVLAGAALGVALAITVARVFEGAMFGFTNVDLLVVIETVSLMVAIAAVGCYVPALRASRLSPTVALRSE